MFMFKALIIFYCTYNYQHYIYLMSMSIYFIFEISIVYNFANKLLLNLSMIDISQL